MGRKPKANYVDNNRLRELTKLYIESNPNDTGDWLDRYERTITTKHKGKNPAKYEACMRFIKFRRELYANPNRPFDKYEEVCNELIPLWYKIITGRLASYRIFGDEDLQQDCIYALLRYINRYDYNLNTSALAYTTELITQAINLHIAEKKKDYLDGLIIPESELFDFRTIDAMFGGDLNEGYEND